MKISRLVIERFTAFEKAEFDFARGINVLLGENSTGKSHVLKLLYVLNEAVRQHQAGEESIPPGQKLTLEERIASLLQGVFQPDQLGRLVRRGVGRRKATVHLVWKNRREHAIQVTLTSLGNVRVTSRDLPTLERSVFIPSREVLSLFPGFMASYLRRESSFDRTYYDLCVSLDAKPLRGPRDTVRARLLEPLEEALGGRVVNERGRFYVKLSDGDMEIPLVAEGLRKLAMLQHLIVNGSLTANGFIFWDEPEANMNPKLTSLNGATVFGLADVGVQSFLATHDYVLTNELTLTAETNPTHATRFFALGRDPRKGGTYVETGDRLDDLQNNAIVQALANLQDRRERAMNSPEPATDSGL